VDQSEERGREEGKGWLLEQTNASPSRLFTEKRENLEGLQTSSNSGSHETREKEEKKGEKKGHLPVLCLSILNAWGESKKRGGRRNLD